MKISDLPHGKSLFEKAVAARAHAYAPYSGCKVGAALKTSDGQIFAGCNVENASYGATICAERVAIQTAMAERGSLQIAEMWVVTDSTPPWAPCGMCRQVIAEFSAQTVIYCCNLKGEVRKVALSELLPDAFTPEKLLPRA